jgi:hypothetical protein
MFPLGKLSGMLSAEDTTGSSVLFPNPKESD